MKVTSIYIQKSQTMSCSHEAGQLEQEIWKLPVQYTRRETAVNSDENEVPLHRAETDNINVNKNSTTRPRTL